MHYAYELNNFRIIQRVKNMKKLILTAVLIVLGLNVGCRLGCTPYDNCGPVYANPYNCTPNYRSGSVLNGATTNQGSVEYATPTNATPTPTVPATAPSTPVTSPTNDFIIPPVNPAPSATPATIPTTTYNRPEYRTNQLSFQSAYRARYPR